MSLFMIFNIAVLVAATAALGHLFWLGYRNRPKLPKDGMAPWPKPPEPPSAPEEFPSRVQPTKPWPKPSLPVRPDPWLAAQIRETQKAMYFDVHPPSRSIPEGVLDAAFREAEESDRPKLNADFTIIDDPMARSERTIGLTKTEAKEVERGHNFGYAYQPKLTSYACQPELAWIVVPPAGNYELVVEPERKQVLFTVTRLATMDSHGRNGIAEKFIKQMEAQIQARYATQYQIPSLLDFIVRGN